MKPNDTPCPELRESSPQEAGQMDSKIRSRGASTDMSPATVLRRLEIVDELRELAYVLQNAKRLGPLNREV